jgi:hypothetical protein
MRTVLAWLIALCCLVWVHPAHAYTWMIRHGYTSCAICHADPSGGGLLTPYGRAQGEILLRSQYGPATDEPGRVKDFLWGVPLPEDWLLLGGDVRDAVLNSKTGSGASSVSTTQFLPMQADLEGQVTWGAFRANASLGYEHEGAVEAQITDRAEDNLVSRLHWVGLDFGEDKAWSLRAGHMNLPFGIRQIEHTFFVRASTRTDTDDAQQDGLALAYTGGAVRGEVMAIIGNYQIRPDAFRERGYAGYLEWAPSTSYAIGISSLLTYAELPNPELPFSPPLAPAPLLRQAHGLFARLSPWKPLVLLVEADGLIDDQPSGVPKGTAALNGGWAGLVQADVEPWQGVHAIVAGEATTDPVTNGGTSVSGWFGAAWFFAPHADVRVDEIVQRLSTGVSTTMPAMTFLAQAHIYL